MTAIIKKVKSFFTEDIELSDWGRGFLVGSVGAISLLLLLGAIICTLTGYQFK